MVEMGKGRTRRLAESLQSVIREFFAQETAGQNVGSLQSRAMPETAPLGGERFPAGNEWPVYFRRVPPKQAPPWVVFLLDGNRDANCRDIWDFDVTLEISGYVGQEDLVDNAMDFLTDHLDAMSYDDDRMSWQIFCGDWGEIPSTDPNLTRRRAVAELRLVERK